MYDFDAEKGPRVKTGETARGFPSARLCSLRNIINKYAFLSGREKIETRLMLFLVIKSLGHTPLMNWIKLGLSWVESAEAILKRSHNAIFLHRSFKPMKMERKKDAQ